ncbi:30S ribosomal protein S17 [Candidatus Woesearchaeota archaeon]|nr:30S ribosomal protein S17 [Candidatus Woesearchaeota archaeon]
MEKNKERKSGIKMEAPTEKCDDRNCPFHGSLKIHGRTFEGTVVSSRMNKTVTVSWQRLKYVRKYERSELKFTKIHAHNPPCINAQKGDKVVIMETRPLSKTKSCVVVQKIGRDVAAELKEQAMDESIREKRKEKKVEKESEEVEEVKVEEE